MVWISAFEKPGDDFLLDQTLQPALEAQFAHMAPRALIKRARARLAQPVRSNAGRGDRGAVQISPRHVLAMRNSLHKDRNAFAGRPTVLRRFHIQRYV